MIILYIFNITFPSFFQKFFKTGNNVYGMQVTIISKTDVLCWLCLLLVTSITDFTCIVFDVDLRNIFGAF